MLAGIAFQLFVLTMATLIAAEYFIRYLLDKPVYSADIDAKESLLINRARLTGKLKTTMWVMTIVVFLLFVRYICSFFHPRIALTHCCKQSRVSHN